MKYLELIINDLSILYVVNQWIPAILLLLIIVLKILSYQLQSNNLKVVIAISMGFLILMFQIPLDFVLLKKGKINNWLFFISLGITTYNITIQILNSFINKDNKLYWLYIKLGNIIIGHKSINLVLSSIFIIITIWYIDIFEKHFMLRIGITLAFLWNLYFTVKVALARIKIYQLSNNKFQTIKIFEIQQGTSLPNPNFIVLLNFLPVNFMFALLYILMRVEDKSSINSGMFDFNNRAISIGSNKDDDYYKILITIVFSILFYEWFSGTSFYYVILVVFISHLLRNKKGFFSYKSVYATTISGEHPLLRPRYYDNIIHRVIPNRMIGGISSIYKSKKEFDYRLIFQTSGNVYISNYLSFTKQKKYSIGNDNLKYNSTNVYPWNEINDSITKHAVIIFNKENNMSNLICEYNLFKALSAPITIIDVLISEYCLDTIFSNQKIENGQNEFRIKRINFLQHLTDENFISSEKEKSLVEDIMTKNGKELSENQKIYQNRTNIYNNIINLPSFESLRQNIYLIENYFNTDDKKRLQFLSQNGIFEFNTLYRQLHESPAIPSRFIDLLNISECIIRHVCGYCHGKRITDNKIINEEVIFDSKSISFGSCTDFLSRWIKTLESKNSILGNLICEFLDSSYDDSKNVDKLIEYIKKLNPNISTKYSRKPNILELSKWLVNIRNKTRGHGTPSKVDYSFYASLEKAILFILSEITKTGITPCIRTTFEGQEWTIDYSFGGLPIIVPITNNFSDELHFNPLMEIKLRNKAKEFQNEILKIIPENNEGLFLKVENGENVEWWCCNDHFMVKSGIVYVLNQRYENKESWISFTTGKIVRPEILVF
jgi:hypothetical protein